MTEQELHAIIDQRSGEQVATALKAIRERNADLGERPVVERISMEGRDGETRNAMALATERRAIALGGALQMLATCRMDLPKAAELASKTEWAKASGVEKILTSGEAVNGGVMIAPVHSQELIDLLAPRTVVRRHISEVVDVSSGMVDMARITSDAATTWGGEIEQITEGSPTLDQLVMRPFQQKVLVPVSNTLLKRGGPRVAAMIRNTTLRSMALGEDQVFLTSPGSEHRPKGLKYWAADANQLTASTFTGTAAQKLTLVSDDLGRLILALEEANVPMTNPVWFMAPRTKQYLLTVRDGNGNKAFPEVADNMLYGWPIEATTHVVRNTGSGANESVVYLADCDELSLGQGSSLEVSMSSEGTFVDVDGNVVSAFQRNLTLLRVINEVGLTPKHREAIGYLSAVTWAPGA